ncbi:MAG TPA: phage integrase N-terminal SAM-like domain-containing protein, partial [Candidatus Acidoferrales bacterium]|nr:phage integrase N-terminal SAM-like domain-containing protein [Candidatus Acidoferrales bacterium]
MFSRAYSHLIRLSLRKHAVSESFSTYTKNVLVGRRLGRNPPSVLGDIHLNSRNNPPTNTMSYGKSANPLELLDEFSKFCRVDLQLAKETIERYKGILRCFSKWFPNDLSQATRDDLRNYMLENYSDSPPNSRANIIRGFRCFYRSFLGSPITDSFRYPRAPFVPKEAPSTENLRLFYNALTKPVHKLLFLLLATSGLRE